MSSPHSLLFSRLNKPGSFSLLSKDSCSSLIIMVLFHDHHHGSSLDPHEGKVERDNHLPYLVSYILFRRVAHLYSGPRL